MLTNPTVGIRQAVLEALYSVIAPNDPYHSVHFRRHARTIEILLEQGISGKVLELGTSMVVPLALKKLGVEAELVVTDFNPERPLKGDFKEEYNSQVLEAECYSLDLESEPLPVEDETFDFIICSEVIEHLDVDPMFMMSEINRVLKTGGKLILTTPNAVSTHSIRKMLSGHEPYFYMQYQKDRSPYRHNYEYSVHSLRQVLKASGLESEVWTENSFEDPWPHDVPKLRAIGYNMKNLGDNLFAVGKKVGPVLERYPSRVYA
jgi:ubiquinone/menaquinone biosynthesis C-methylase UbiE